MNATSTIHTVRFLPNRLPWSRIMMTRKYNSPSTDQKMKMKWPSWVMPLPANMSCHRK